jgi:putative Flp pilus-assembly TadE/G-like protein
MQGKKLNKSTIFRSAQSGQAMVFVLIFTTIMIVSMATLYKAGKLTSDKMELQNAADAAAYSVSVIEARDLNFASYMNRAIVANEVAVGQMMGLASFAYHWRSFHDYLKLYSTPLKTPPITPLGTALEGMANAFRTTGDRLINNNRFPGLPFFANHATTMVHYINWFYGGSQRLFHLASTAYALGAIDEMIEQNGPEDAELSEFGMLSLIGHLATYGALPGLPGEKFTRSYDPRRRSDFADFQADIAGNTDAGGYGRLAALIHESADPFTNARGWVFDFFKEMNKITPLPGFLYSERNGQGWFGPDIGGTLNFLDTLYVQTRIWLQIHIDLTRAGGSELRPIPRTTGPRNRRNQVSGERFNWSSVDTTNLGLGVDGGAVARVRICDPTGVFGCSGWATILNVQLVAVNDRITASVGLPLGFGTLTLIDTPFPTNVPFGAAFVQAGKDTSRHSGANTNFMTSNRTQIGTTNATTAPFRGPIPVGRYQDYPNYDGPSEWPDAAYGGAANSLLAWEFPLPPGIFYQAGMTNRRINNRYAGLPAYIDTANNNPIQGSGGPNLVLGVTLSEANFDLKNPAPGQPQANETEPEGRFKINERMANNEIHAIAKSEVYFKRPTDLSYFRRGDGQTEYGSTFNPYWNARLVETSHADRDLALFMEQQVDINNNASNMGPVSSLMALAISILGL